MAGTPRAESGHRHFCPGKSRRDMQCHAICQRQINMSEEIRTDRHSFERAREARRGRRKRVLSHTGVTEEPLDDLTNQCIWEGRLRCVLCNEIIRAAATADPDASDSSLSIEVRKISCLNP